MVSFEKVSRNDVLTSTETHQKTTSLRVFGSYLRNLKNGEFRHTLKLSAGTTAHGSWRFFTCEVSLPKTSSTLYMDVSENRGIPKSSILIGFSIVNHPFWGIPIFGNTHFVNTLGDFFVPKKGDPSRSRMEEAGTKKTHALLECHKSRDYNPP